MNYIIYRLEFDNREVGHSSLQIQQEMKHMIKSFEKKVIHEINLIKTVNCGGGLPQLGLESNTTMPELQSGGCHGGRWYYWKEKFRRFPNDWTFPHMTLQSAFHKYFLPDITNII